MRVVGVDIGGTNIAAAVVEADHTVVDRTKVKTPAGGPEAVVGAIVDMVGRLGSVDALGAGVPGPVNDGRVMSAPNLPGWTEPVALAERLADELGVPVVVDNDGTVGAVGEWVAGSARGARNVLGAWLGTGVGGGLVLEGRPFRGSYGGAGELGHVVVQRGGALCGCGRRGCLEAYAGRASMERAARVRIAAGVPSVLPEIMAERGKSRMTSSVWAEAMQRDGQVATVLIDEAVEALGVAVGSAINLLDLDTVVVGGGLAEKLGQPLADRIAEAARPHLLVPSADRRVVVAELGDDSGVVGAAWVARQEVDPS
jgi:glucokinase